jgi:DNA-binding beta-propeller fold protein YncE
MIPDEFGPDNLEDLMKHLALFSAYLIAATTGVAMAQAAIDPAFQHPEPTVAYVYVQTSRGTVLYDASSSGMLTRVTGSPFNTSGNLVGTNGEYLITSGPHDLRTYKVGAFGQLGPPTSQFDTQSHAGGQCGDTAGAVLDHSGKDVYVSLKGAPGEGGNNLCDALQTSSLSSSGTFTFKGDLLVDEESKSSGTDTLPVLLGSNKFAYSLEGIPDGCEHTINIFARESSGALEFAPGQDVTFPAGPSGGYYYYPLFPSNVDASFWPSLITDDPTDHLAIALYAEADAPCGITKTPQLASFTADSKGNLTTTNTAEDMPSIAGSGINIMRLSPSGDLLAVATGTGVQIFHFNGSHPITKFTGVIGKTGFIRDLAWDKNNHLYAINGANGNLHVYTITTTTAVEVAGSPYAAAGTHLVVVPE